MRLRDTIDRAPSPTVATGVAVLAIALAIVSAAPRAAVAAGVSFTPAVQVESALLPAIGDQFEVDSANGPSGMQLVVWTTERAGGYDIFGARVQGSIVRDPDGIQIAVRAPWERAPAVSWNGTNWLVVWREGQINSDLRCARVDTGGIVLEGLSTTILCNAAGRQDTPGVAWNGSLWIVVFADSSSGTIRGTTVSSAGVPYNTGLASAVAPLGGSSPAIAATDTALVVWSDFRSVSNDIYGCRVRGTTSAANPVVRVDASDLLYSSSSSSESQPTIAANANGWLVLWQLLVVAIPSQYDIYGRHVARSGAAVDATPIAIVTNTASETAPSTGWNGLTWTTAWFDASTVKCRFVPASSGAPSGTVYTVATGGGSPTCTSLCFPSGAVASVAYIKVSSGGTEAEDDLYTRDVSLVGPGGSEHLVTTQTPNQVDGSYASAAGRWCVAWSDDRYTGAFRQIRLGLTNDETLDAPNAPFWLSPNTTVDQFGPCVVFDGTDFNVFWSEGNDAGYRVRGARVRTSGTVRDTFTVSSGPLYELRPQAVYVSGRIVVVWIDYRTGAGQLWGRKVNNGAPEGSEFLVSNDSFEDLNHVIASDGTVALVAFESDGGFETGLFTARISNIPGVPVVESGAAIITVDTAYKPTGIEWNGRLFAITYTARAASGAAVYQAKVQRLRNDRLLFGVPIDLGATQTFTPAPVVATNGYTWTYVWSRPTAGNPDLFYARMEKSPIFQDPVNAPPGLTTDARTEFGQRLIRGRGDRMGYSYQINRRDPQWDAWALYVGSFRDTLEGKIVINEFVPNPHVGRKEFYELKNNESRKIDLQSWRFYANANVDSILCACDTVPFQSGAYRVDSTFTASGTPDGFFPNRHAVLKLVSPAGTIVDMVAYGDSGAAPVSSSLPESLFAAAGTGPTPRAAIGLDGVGAGAAVALGSDSVIVSTARLPDGVDTDNDGADFNLSVNGTAGVANQGQAAALGTSLFFSRVYAHGVNDDAVELYNPTGQIVNFDGWFLSDGENTRQIGWPNNVWTQVRPGEKRVLHRAEPGSFDFGLDYDDVLYLYDATMQRVEQMAWWRDDSAFPDMCATRVPDTGGLHTGNSWITSGGQQDLFSGELRYQACSINAAQIGVDPAPAAALAFAGAAPNPASLAAPAWLVFSLPGSPGEASMRVRLRLFDAAGRLVQTAVDAALPPGEYRLPMVDRTSGGRILRAGVYFAELEAGGRRLLKNVVVLP